MNSLIPQNPQTQIYYTAVSAKLLKSCFSRWPTVAILDFCQLRLMPTLLRATPPAVLFIDLQRRQNTKKRTFALHGHGSAPDDPTNGVDPPTPKSSLLFIRHDIYNCSIR